MRAILVLALAASLPARSARAATPAFPMVLEAEGAAITCRAGAGTAESLWASGGRTAPAGWGRAAGDTVTWQLDLPAPRAGLRAVLRYARAGVPSSKGRALRLVIDSGAPVGLMLRPTGGTEDFDNASCPLPPIAAGRHRLTLASPGDGDPLAIDALMLLEPGDAPPLRRTVLARAPSGHFIVRATAQAPLQMEPGRIVSEFERIYARYHDYFGFAPERPIGIHVIEGARWPEPGASAFQNDDGVFFRAEAMATEQGNFCHEMTHMFYLGHLPRWMDEPSVHALTTMVWMPALYPNETDPGTRARGERSRGAGEAFWANLTEQYDSVEPVLDALIVRYGPDVYRRFFHACVEAGKAGEIDFTPNRHLTRAEVVHLMSRAAGEDVESVFRRWRGFAEAAP